jgi:hypothetical protein
MLDFGRSCLLLKGPSDEHAQTVEFCEIFDLNPSPMIGVDHLLEESVGGQVGHRKVVLDLPPDCLHHFLVHPVELGFYMG